jgi:crossover junction endodeoxyribonuclease RuvC
LRLKRGKSIKTEPQAHLMAAALRAWMPIDLAIIEQVHGRPGEAVGAVGSFMRARGQAEGACAGLGVLFQLVDAAKWTRDMKVGKGDDAGRMRALALCPTVADQLAKKKDHNRADALLLALWGLHYAEHPFL